MKKLVVLLDNGHGKNTPGKRSPKWKDIPQIFEWEYNRFLVNKIHCRLQDLGIKSLIVVQEEIDISLSERVKRIKEYEKQFGKENCLTLSVHLNASDPNPNARGWEAHTYLGHSKSDVYAKEFYKQAKKYLSDNTRIRLGGSEADPDWDSNFAILRGPAGPAILTENCFMTNYEDCKYLLSEEGKKELVQLHVDAILEIQKLS